MQSRVTRPGAEIAVYSLGKGVPVLAIHGFASSARANWSDSGWARALTAHGCRLIALDLRGHGDSGKPHMAPAYSMPLLVGDLIAVLDELDVGRAHVIGYSLGSRLAIQLALTVPARVFSLTLGGVGLETPFCEFDADGARRCFGGGTEPVSVPTARILTMARSLRANDVEALIALAEALRSDPGVTEVPDVPLVVVNGESDKIATDGAELARRAPLGHFVQLPARTHANAVSARAFKKAGLDLILA